VEGWATRGHVFRGHLCYHFSWYKATVRCSCCSLHTPKRMAATRRVFDVCAAHALPRETATEIALALAEEPYLGSALDISEALLHIESLDACALADRQSLCEALLPAVLSRRRKRSLPATSSIGGGLDQFTWKREFKHDRDRYHEPYTHALFGHELVLEQRPFGPEGFASTVWDSAIVLARYLEVQGAAQYAGARCVELGAGTGLPGLVLAALGAQVVLTDLPENVALLELNVARNRDACRRIAGGQNVSGTRSRSSAVRRRHGGGARAAESQTTGCATSMALRWGEALPKALPEALSLRPASKVDLDLDLDLDLVVATDVLYSHEAVSPLVETLVALSSPKTQVLLAAGRNQHAGDGFWAAARAWFEVHEVSTNALHAAYRCDDVTVWRLQRFEKS